jgi:hypothetical protein
MEKMNSLAATNINKLASMLGFNPHNHNLAQAVGSICAYELQTRISSFAQTL